jgi:hypothetical protein
MMLPAMAATTLPECSTGGGVGLGQLNTNPLTQTVWRFGYQLAMFEAQLKRHSLPLFS